MKCIICCSNSRYYFSKTYSESPFDNMMRYIGEVDYYKCENCGFVISCTHAQLNEKQWENLNYSFHSYIENSNNEKKGNQPPYAEQAMMLSFLGKNRIIRIDDIVDYAAGYGTLSKILFKYHGIKIKKFDKFIQNENQDVYINEKELKTYKTVINSAMFEHILKRSDLERLNNTVAVDGCLIIHTVVCENVPNDPNWFYLRQPVHTAFHTNRSMEILMKQWGYRSSIYSPQSKCWVLLKDKIEKVEKKIDQLNNELQHPWFYCKNGFVDYWKGF